MKLIRRVSAYVLKNKIESAVISFIALYTTSAVLVSLFRYWQFQTTYFDFGIYDQAIWQVSRFKIPIVYHPNFLPEQKIIFADHFNPSIFLFSPLYWITHHQEVLLIAQSIIVGLSGVVGYFISKEFIKNKIAIFALIFSYLGFIGMQNALITDFHDATVLTLPLMISFWAAVKRKWLIFYTMLIVILGFKESFAGLGLGLGIFIVLSKRNNFKYGILAIFISLVWGYLAVNKIIPFFSGTEYFYTSAGSYLDPKSVLNGILSFDTRARTLLYSFLNFGFLPLFNIALLPAIAENFIERFISSSGTRWTLGLHYSAPLDVLMFVSSVFVFSKLEKTRKFKKIIFPYSLVIILITLILHQFVLRGPLALSYNPVFYKQTKDTKYISDFLDKMPKDGLIMTQNNLAPRFSHNNIILIEGGYERIAPDYVILNLTKGQSLNNFFPMRYDEALELKKALLHDKDYRMKKFGEELYLFSKN